MLIPLLVKNEFGLQSVPNEPQVVKLKVLLEEDALHETTNVTPEIVYDVDPTRDDEPQFDPLG